MTQPSIIRDPGLAARDEIRHAFFTKRGGVSDGLYASLNAGFGSGDAPNNVAENRRRATAAIGAGPEALSTVYQVHGTTVVKVASPWAPAEAPKADGMVSNSPGVALGVLTADCAPVLFADATAGVVGACHAGWKGALNGIVEATVAAMEGIGARRADIQAAIGPCIAQESYEVGDDFEAAFIAHDPSARTYFTAGAAPHKRQFNLPGFVLRATEKAGLANAQWVARDTRAESDLFFSYRRATIQGEADYGRLLSVIALNG